MFIYEIQRCFVTIRDSLRFFCPKRYTGFKGLLCGLEIPTKKAILGPRALGPIGSQISQKRSSSFFWNICRASASKRIIANQLEHNVYWTLKFHFLYCRGAMVKSGSFVRHVTSRHMTHDLFQNTNNRTPSSTTYYHGGIFDF